MLLNFSVSNFKSFDDKEVLSLISSSKIIRHSNHIIKKGNKKILKNALIYGLNNSGKSNLIEAIKLSRSIIIEEDIIPIKDFKLNNESKPTEFEYNILINDNVYKYTLSIYNMEIIKESLIRNEKIIIFEKKVIDNECFLNSDLLNNNKIEEVEKRKLRIYLMDARKNKTILSDISKRAIVGIFKEISDVYKWFEDTLFILNPKINIINELNNKDLFISFLKGFDIDISSISEDTIPFDEVINRIKDKGVIDKNINRIINSNTDSIIRVEDEIYRLSRNSRSTKIMLNNHNVCYEFSEESNGVKKLFDLIGIIMKKSGVIIVDDLDMSLHPKIVRFYLETFFNNSSNNKQLISILKDSTILDLDLIRQDEVIFINKDNNEKSRIYSLGDFSERFDKKIDKNYLKGKYDIPPNNK